MERTHHEKNPVAEMRLTRSRARSLERQAQRQQQEQRKQRASSSDKRAVQQQEEQRELELETQATGKEGNVFQADSAKDKNSGVEQAATALPRVSPTAAKAKPVAVESLSQELAQARKEAGLSEFTGEHPITPAPLQPTAQSAARIPTAAITASCTSQRDAIEPALSTPETEASPLQQAGKRKSSSRASKIPVRASRPTASERVVARRGSLEERKEEPASHAEEAKHAPLDEEDNRSLFSTALPSPLSPSERKESPLEWERHDSALSFERASFTPPSLSYSSSDADDNELAWRLQQEEFEAAAASRSIHTFLSELSYQPAWLRLSLSVCLVINVLLPLLFVPNPAALVTLSCQALQLGFAYWLYRVYDFTPHLFYSTALLLPSLLFLVDAHVLRTGWGDVALLGAALLRRPTVLLDGVVLRYLWQWASVAVQAVELAGGMWLALKVR